MNDTAANDRTDGLTMDFGIKAAALAGLHVYEAASRGTGRTETTLRALKDGDVLLVGTADEARRVERECRLRGPKVRVVTVGDMRRGSLHAVRGRLVVDHTAYSWMVLDAINSVDAELRSLRVGIKPADEKLQPVMSFAFNDRSVA